MNQSEQINELASALAKAQPNIKPAKKDKSNPFFKSKYADFPTIWNACEKPLNDQGLAVVQALDFLGNQLVLITKLMHTSGQWISSVAPILPVKNDPQAYGSAISYMKRYALAALVGVSVEDEDDDANTASAPSHNGNSRANIQVATIGKVRGKELEEMLLECEGEYQKRFWSYANTKVPGIKSLDALPVDIYDQVKAIVIKKKEEAQAKQLEQEPAEVMYG